MKSRPKTISTSLRYLRVLRPSPEESLMLLSCNAESLVLLLLLNERLEVLVAVRSIPWWLVRRRRPALEAAHPLFGCPASTAKVWQNSTWLLPWLNLNARNAASSSMRLAVASFEPVAKTAAKSTTIGMQSRQRRPPCRCCH